MKHVKLFEAWNLEKDSKLPKKGDRVKIDPEQYQKDREAHKKMMLQAGLPKDHPAIKELDAPDEVLKRAKAGEVATVTKAENSRSPHAYADLKFDDGFECGASYAQLIRVE